MQRKHNLNGVRKKIFKYSAIFAAVSALTVGINSLIVMTESHSPLSSVGHGDVDTLKVALNNWRSSYEAKGGNPEVLKLLMGYSKALSGEYTQGHGQFQLNLKNGEVVFQAEGLDTGKYDLWLVDNLNGSVMPKAGDMLIQVGTFEVADNRGKLETHLERGKLLGFKLDSVIVSKAGQTPQKSVVITGAPDLMHKLYYADKPWLTTAMGDVNAYSPEAALPFEFLLPKAVQADTLSDLTPVLGGLVAKGREIFHNETFDGNGRTCDTCHRADNNFTLDPNYIMSLPSTDPLFVAETNPELADLEDPVLMRKHALIKTNVDGPQVDIYRSVPHTLSLFTTIDHECDNNPKAPPCDFGDSGLGGAFGVGDGGEFPSDNASFAHSTGWSGDGAPGSGSLREFTLGAIAQHMPLTMARMPNVDFRVPTADELDAVEAYMLSLGRSKDYPIYQLKFQDPLVQVGKDLFDTKTNPVNDDGVPILGATANCNGCHQNGGGRSSSTKANPTRNTGIENMSIHPAHLLKPDMAYDGGFGVEQSVCGPEKQVCYGDGRFSTPPLIEAADTAPYFHNNAVSTLEEAIAAYNSDAFNSSPGHLSKVTDRSVKLDSTQIVAVASFLRAINAIENIRLSDQLDKQAMHINNNKTSRELVHLASEENNDAIEVLKEGKLGTNWKAVQFLEQAAYYEKLAKKSPGKALRNRLIRKALEEKKQARDHIASCDPNAKLPADVKLPQPVKAFLYTCEELGLKMYEGS